MEKLRYITIIESFTGSLSFRKGVLGWGKKWLIINRILLLSQISVHKSPKQYQIAESAEIIDSETSTVQNAKPYSPLDTEGEENYFASDAFANVAPQENAPLSSRLTERVASSACNRANSLNDDGLANVARNDMQFTYRVRSFEKYASSVNTEYVEPSAYMARKIDLGDALRCSDRSSDCNDGILNSFDYRFRYGLSSLEICSKYASRRDNVFSKREKYAAYSDRITCQASTAAAFFAR